MSDGGTTIGDLLAEITAREVSTRVLLRQELLAEHAALEAELLEAGEVDGRENRDPVAPQVAQRIADLEAKSEAARRTFTFRAIGSRRWADLIAKHPPTKEQLRQHARLDHNPETFPPVAIAASCISPVMTVEEVRELEDRLPLTPWQQLYTACLDANTGGGESPKSWAAGAILRANAELGATAVNGESRAASS